MEALASRDFVRTEQIKEFISTPGPVNYILAMPSFDIVSQVNSMELENAINQAK
jgi:hypothetical protein